MGFFDSLSGGDWLDLAGTVAQVGTQLFAGSKAADAQKDAGRAAQGDIREGREQAYGFVDTGADRAGGFVAPMVPLGDNARQYLASVMAHDPSQLTQSQRIGFEDTMRATKQGLAGGGLRGAGRAGVAVLGDVAGRYLAGAHDTNQARSDRAAAGLESRGAAGRTGLANIEQQRGTSKAASATGTASQLATLQTGVGAAEADNWNNVGNTIGAGIGAAQEYNQPSVVELIASMNADRNAYPGRR